MHTYMCIFVRHLTIHATCMIPRKLLVQSMERYVGDLKKNCIRKGSLQGRFVSHLMEISSGLKGKTASICIKLKTHN